MTLTFDAKINRGHLPAKTNPTSKFEGKQPMRCQVIERKLFYLQGQFDLDIWPQNQ
jgi:hypothetical protein